MLEYRIMRKMCASNRWENLPPRFESFNKAIAWAEQKGFFVFRVSCRDTVSHPIVFAVIFSHGEMVPPQLAENAYELRKGITPQKT